MNDENDKKRGIEDVDDEIPFQANANLGEKIIGGCSNPNIPMEGIPNENNCNDDERGTESTLFDEWPVDYFDDISDEQVMNLKFDSIEAACSFYNLYSKMVGFSTRKGDEKRIKMEGLDSTFEQAIDSLQSGIAEATSNTENTSVVPITELKALEMHTYEVYTHNVFCMVRKQLQRQGLFMTIETIQASSNVKYLLETTRNIHVRNLSSVDYSTTSVAEPLNIHNIPSCSNNPFNSYVFNTSSTRNGGQTTCHGTNMSTKNVSNGTPKTTRFRFVADSTLMTTHMATPMSIPN
ncbi:hypothetical protein M9H77_35772 [Catharanthus roseus]|uniref:Uncharacterized protein n=1 Tax=Catharanthus roseus TaxID=4058 RepID=A0ACB9ZS47_CATRO|nr:hypothetical protein M9H77_35772 [Catharanthus roseus]